MTTFVRCSLYWSDVAVPLELANALLQAAADHKVVVLHSNYDQNLSRPVYSVVNSKYTEPRFGEVTVHSLHPADAFAVQSVVGGAK